MSKGALLKYNSLRNDDLVVYFHTQVKLPTCSQSVLILKFPLMGKNILELFDELPRTQDK